MQLMHTDRIAHRANRTIDDHRSPLRQFTRTARFTRTRSANRISACLERLRRKRFRYPVDYDRGNRG